MKTISEAQLFQITEIINKRNMDYIIDRYIGYWFLNTAGMGCAVPIKIWSRDLFYIDKIEAYELNFTMEDIGTDREGWSLIPEQLMQQVIKKFPFLFKQKWRNHYENNINFSYTVR